MIDCDPLVALPASGPALSASPARRWADLIRSRQAWLQEVLRPWCASASRQELLLAEQDWPDLAGRVAPEKTLWPWAWQRFPALVHPELGLDETREVLVTIGHGQQFRGYPDARSSQRGQLVLVAMPSDGRGFVAQGPWSIDDIVAVDPVAPCLAAGSD